MAGSYPSDCGDCCQGQPGHALGMNVTLPLGRLDESGWTRVREAPPTWLCGHGKCEGAQSENTETS